MPTDRVQHWNFCLLGLSWIQRVNGSRQINKLLIVASILAAASSSGASPANIEQPRVTLPSGVVEGTTVEGITSFKGLPFAEPPNGSLRWKPPRPTRPWAGVLRAHTFKPACMQREGAQQSVSALGMSEDCLYLNLWVPAATIKNKLPVMVWIHGGAFNLDTPSNPLYSGAALAKHGVIVVNLAYRLGALGFLAHPELTAESGGASGNYGLMDMIAGLRWVKDNIGNFGGDADNVTIFGESAGAFAVSMLYVSPLSKGLFHRAIAQSGAVMAPARSGFPISLQSRSNMEAYGLSVQEKLGARSLAELRGLPAQKFVEFFVWASLDGRVLPDDVVALMQSGQQNDVPLLLGHNDGEGDNQLGTPYDPLYDTKQYKEFVRSRFGAFADQVLARYPAQSEEEGQRSQRRLYRDSQWGWPMWSLARMQTKTGTGQVFEYYFAHIPPWPSKQPFANWGAVHTADLFYTMNFPEMGTRWTDRDREIADQMKRYWTNFARTGDPNGEGLPHWEPFTAESERLMFIGERTEMRPQPHREELMLLDGFMTELRSSRDRAGYREPSSVQN